MDKRTKVKLRIVLIVILLVGIIVTPVVCIITHWVEKNIVTDIEDYNTHNKNLLLLPIPAIFPEICC